MKAKELTALKAVLYGCATNKKLEGATYFKRSTKESIDFSEAVDIVAEMIEGGGSRC